MNEIPFISGPSPRYSDLTQGTPLNDIDYVVPLAKVQHALWLDYIRQPDGNHYNLTLRVDVGAYPLEGLMNSIFYF